jgi:hypothetical protein
MNGIIKLGASLGEFEKWTFEPDMTQPHVKIAYKRYEHKVRLHRKLRKALK